MSDAGEGRDATAAPLPANVVAFLKGHVTSLLQLEALLLVVESEPAARTVGDIAAEMYVPSEAVAGWLSDFAAGGFCSADAGRYSAPKDEATYDLLNDVADAYLRRPVSVGRLIFGSGRDDLASLSEAFRLRKEW